MMTDDELSAYLTRIGWAGSTEPTPETLAGLLDAHLKSIPFENLDVLLGRPPRLTLEAIHAKLVGARRGGYCFEHSTLFAAVLERFGYQPVRHSARVILYLPRGESTRGHMFLSVRVPGSGETVVLDPGFGGLAPRVPLPLVEGDGAGGATHWLVRDGDYWMLRARTKEGIVDAWISTFEKDTSMDFEMANHFVATHPASAFVNRLFLRAFTPDGRVTVMNRDLTVVNGDQVYTEQMADRSRLRSILQQYFGFDLPEVESLHIPTVPEWQ